MSRVTVRFYQSPGLVGKLIRWQTRAPVGHVALYWPELQLWTEAVEGKGVVQRDTERPDLHDHASVALPRYDAAKLWAFAQLGKPYDYLMVARFISRRGEDPDTRARFFCSEYAAHVLRIGGVLPLANSAPWKESPALLYLSPVLFPPREGPA